MNRTFVPALALSQPLDEAELDELERFLVSDQTSDETLTLSMLDGYLTALVIGPVTIVPSRWFPRVWGSRDDHAPVWDSMQQMERIMSLLLRHMNGIVAEFDAEPESFEPLFDAFEYRKRKYACGEGWAMGFMRGVELARADWQALFDDPKMAEALAPLLLLGADEPLSDAEERIVRTPLQRERLARKIPASLAAIHAFWMPYRITRATTEAPPTTLLRAGPKVGRNEPCPCGSGAKFKKCCGEGAT